MFRFIQFNDEKIDSMLAMELSDLVKTLTKVQEFETEFRVHSYLNEIEKKVYVSHFWNHREQLVVKDGLKSDVFLRALGNYKYTDAKEVIRYRQLVYETKLPRLGLQLFALAEDLRVEELCKRERPGMKKEFRTRRHTYLKHFKSQLKANLEKNFLSDALFAHMYIFWNKSGLYVDVPDFDPGLQLALPNIERRLEALYEAGTTQDIADLSMDIVRLIEQAGLADMINEYFHLPNPDNFLVFKTWDENLKRKDPLRNSDSAETDGQENVFEEEMKTWHRETKDPGKTFLQFELEQGTQTKILGDGARKGEAGDQALAIVQGSSKKTAGKDFSNLEAMEGTIDNENLDGGAPYGLANKNAVPIFLSPDEPSKSDKEMYVTLQKEILHYKRKLKNIIDQTLEHRKELPRTNIQAGRLNNKLTRFFTDEHPQLFYKKSEPSPTIDAVFSLLIDCSASMHDKMSETRLGVALFHEALKSVKVPHEVTGFWEDANKSSDQAQPNFFNTVIRHETSLKAATGAEIMKLDAEEDNRDGFAIRVMAKKLVERRESQKFLIVFSDGEPAAFGYEQNGIIDTHEAVLEARKRGIAVFNVFLSKDGVGEEQKKVFRNIYGKYSIIVPDISKLPDTLFPLLKNLLFQSLDR